MKQTRKKPQRLYPAADALPPALIEDAVKAHLGDLYRKRVPVTWVAAMTQVRKVALGDISEATVIDRVLILSLMPSLYTARLEIEGQTYLLTEKGTSIRRPSAEALKRILSRAQVGEYRMIHSSAYDEMIGQGIKVENQMDVPA
ncbi:MAG: DUF6482 family protein [Halieaceae bacterium]|nr:DUF6482 family protein [Halieaceae bacterium]